MYKQIASNKRRSAFLILVFILLILVLVTVYGYVSDIGIIAPIIAFAFTLPSALLGYYYGDKLVLFVSGARQIERKDNKEIYNLVENLGITAGLPTPKIYIIPTPAMNAFATGRDLEHASIALTSGIVSKLKRVELEGVIGHELSHIKNYDIRLATVVVIFVGIIALLSHWFLRFNFLFGGRGRRRGGGGQIAAILALVGIVLALLSPLIAKLIQLALSRQREYLADADSALLTRYPEGLAGALEKIAGDPNPFPNPNGATAHLYISSPFKKSKVLFSSLFSTHPPIKERVKRLRGMIKQ